MCLSKTVGPLPGKGTHLPNSAEVLGLPDEDPFLRDEDWRWTPVTWALVLDSSKGSEGRIACLDSAASEERSCPGTSASHVSLLAVAGSETTAPSWDPGRGPTAAWNHAPAGYCPHCGSLREAESLQGRALCIYGQPLLDRGGLGVLFPLVPPNLPNHLLLKRPLSFCPQQPGSFSLGTGTGKLTVRALQLSWTQEVLGHM